jgi:Phage tail tube protein
MTTTIPSGLGATLGMSKEASGYGSETTVARWFNIDAGEGFGLKKHIAQSKALSGSRFELSKRRVLVAKDAGGKFSLDACETGLGLIFQGVLGSAATAVQQASTAAYLQQHVPGTTLVGFSYNFQKGIPEVPSGTIVPLSYPGSKFLDIEFSCQVDQIAKLAVTLDAQFEDTVAAYAAVTFPDQSVFHWDEGALLLGGTPSTSSGIVTVSGGSAPTGVVTSASIKITNKLNTARYDIGSQTKSEPVENDFVAVTGEMEIEFAAVADYYTAMAADTVTTLQLNFTDPTAIASTYHPFIDIVLPAIRFEDASPQATSTDVVKVKVPFTALNDGTDPVVQISYQSTDTAV